MAERLNIAGLSSSSSAENANMIHDSHLIENHGQVILSLFSKLNLPSSIRDFIAGGLGSVFAKTATAPLARTTILLQTQTLPLILKRPEFVLSAEGHGYYSYREPRGLGRSMAAVAAADGFSGLWKGNVASCIHRVPYAGVTFLLHGKLIEQGYGQLSAGAVAGAVAAVAAYPLDVVKTRIATQDVQKTVMGSLVGIYRSEGVRGLYRGLVPSVMHVAPSFALSFSVYAASKDKLKNVVALPAVSPLICGSISGLVAGAVMFPIDVVRRRMQVNSGAGMIACAQKIWLSDGMRGFYRGLPAELAKVVPYVSVLFFSVETIKAQLNRLY